MRKNRTFRSTRAVRRAAGIGMLLCVGAAAMGSVTIETRQEPSSTFGTMAEIQVDLASKVWKVSSGVIVAVDLYRQCSRLSIELHVFWPDLGASTGEPTILCHRAWWHFAF